MGEEHAEGGRIVLDSGVDEFAEPGARQSEVQPEHLRPVEV
jgi:hypothetical protein